MTDAAEIDALLAPLAAPLRREADAILDLWTCARARTAPGRCLLCYFSLFQAADQPLRPHLQNLRDWLQARIEAIACDEDGRQLETLPIDLEAADIETCCRQIMNEMHENRAYDTPCITLQFRYRSPAPLAA